MNIIPAIDIIDGKCVRLSGGNYDLKTIYSEQPLDLAKSFEDAGLTRLHLVDLDGSKAKAVKNWKVLESIAAHTSLVIDFSGGILTSEDVQIVFDSGASLAAIGSLAVKQPDTFITWLNTWGPEKFLLAADVRDEKITIHGWLEQTELPIIDFIQSYKDRGLTQVFCTDVGKDGMLKGPATELYRKILATVPGINLIASGGVSTLSDLDDLLEVGCSGVIIGKAIYEGRISLDELKQWAAKHS